MGKVKYDLKDSKKIIGPLYPRLLDKEGREIDGFHREEADEDWPTRQLDHIDTDVKYWTARLVANTHRRKVSKEERKKEVIELAKALRAEGHRDSLVNPISELTTFSKQYIRGFLPKEYKQDYTVPDKSKLGFESEQKKKKTSRKQTSDKEKLDNLYKKVENSAFTGKKCVLIYKLKAEKLGLDVTQYTEELEKIKQILRDSVGRQYADVKDSLNDAFESSAQMKKVLTAQITAEETRRKKLKESLRPEITKEVTQAEVEIAEKEKRETKLAEKQKKKEKRAEATADFARSGTTIAQIKKQDCIDFLNELEDKSVDLLLTDPPYSTDVTDIETFVDSWLPLSLSKIKDTGQAYIFIGAYAREFRAYLSTLVNIENNRFGEPQVLVWTYKNTIGQKPTNHYKRNWQAILYLRAKDAPAINCVNIVDQCSVQEFSQPDGRNSIKYHPWEKPIDLAKRLIIHGSVEGDYVVDPFAGSGTFLLASAEFGRKNLGVDFDDAVIETAVERGCILIE